MTRTAVATLMPVRDKITQPTLDALKRDGLNPYTVVGRPVDEARNELARIALALKPEPDVVLWIDADAWWPPGTIPKLLSVLANPEVDLVSGYFGRRAPFGPPTIEKTLGNADSFVRLGEDCPLDGVLQVGFAGLHFVAHRRSLLERIGPDPFSDNGLDRGEDAALCRRVLDVGGIIVCHTGAPVAHIGDDGFAYLPGGPRFTIRDGTLIAVPTAAPIRKEPRRDRNYGPGVNASLDAALEQMRDAA